MVQVIKDPQDDETQSTETSTTTKWTPPQRKTSLDYRIAQEPPSIRLIDKALKENNRQLAKKCIENLNSSITKETALSILVYLSKLLPQSDPSNIEPSAPPMVSQSAENIWAIDSLENLRHKCHTIIDNNADFILQQPEMLDLSYVDILDITTRDSLEVSKEVVVFNCVMKWGREACRKGGIEESKIGQVLKNLIYAPRYGLMSEKEFLSQNNDDLKGPGRCGLLTESEIEKILHHIKNKSKRSPQNLPHKGSTPRAAGYDRRSESSMESSPKMERTTKEKCVLNFLTCWTAVFD